MIVSWAYRRKVHQLTHRLGALHCSGFRETSSSRFSFCLWQFAMENCKFLVYSCRLRCTEPPFFGFTTVNLSLVMILLMDLCEADIKHPGENLSKSYLYNLMWIPYQLHLFQVLNSVSWILGFCVDFARSLWLCVGSNASLRLVRRWWVWCLAWIRPFVFSTAGRS